MVILLLIVLVIALTVLTQIGGFLLLLALPLLSLITVQSFWLQGLLRIGVFLLIYLLVAFLLVPRLASWTGRVPLPCFAGEQEPLKPANIGYCLLLRNYVTPAIKTRLLALGQQFRESHPGSTLRYLDASFPFLNGFPLLPHLSHKDGRKVDFAYFYQRKFDRQAVDYSPNWLGYWFYEQAPTPEDEACRGQKNWLRWNFAWLQARYADYELDEARTRTLLQLLVKDAQKVLLEPHLQRRLGVQADNLRFQGCHAARHDDHIHAQW